MLPALLLRSLARLICKSVECLGEQCTFLHPLAGSLGKNWYLQAVSNWSLVLNLTRPQQPDASQPARGRHVVSHETIVHQSADRYWQTTPTTTNYVYVRIFTATITCTIIVLALEDYHDRDLSGHLVVVVVVRGRGFSSSRKRFLHFHYLRRWRWF